MRFYDILKCILSQQVCSLFGVYGDMSKTVVYIVTMWFVVNPGAEMAEASSLLFICNCIFFPKEGAQDRATSMRSAMQ